MREARADGWIRRVRIDGRGDDARLAPWLDALPGRYRAALLPHAHLVVDLEPLEDDEAYCTRHTATLLRARSLDEATLIANRAGRALPNQLPRMRRSDFVIAGIGLLILLIGVLLAWMIDLGRDDRRFTGELTMLMFAGVAATLLWTGGKIVLAAAAPLATSPTLNFIAGTLSKHALEMGGSRRYYVSIERRLFDVSYDEYAHVLAGLEYRAYFFPVRNQLAALEPIERDEPEPKDMTAYRD